MGYPYGVCVNDCLYRYYTQITSKCQAGQHAKSEQKCKQFLKNFTQEDVDSLIQDC